MRLTRVEADNLSFNCLLDLLAEGATLGKPALSTSGLREDNVAASTNDSGLSVTEDGRDGEASWASNIHEEGVGVLYKALKLMLHGLLLGVHVKIVELHFHKELPVTV